MREDGRQSDNVEDRRGSSGTRRVVGGGIGTVILVLVAMYFGVDPAVLVNLTQTATSPPTVRQVGKICFRRSCRYGRHMADSVSAEQHDLP
jgi:predicted metalloprotease